LASVAERRDRAPAEQASFFVGWIIFCQPKGLEH
jgi:hypothetical protein